MSHVLIKVALLMLATILPFPQFAQGDDERWEIAPGVHMPVVNLGHPDEGGTETTSALKWLKLGGRGIDTAFSYHNQDQVGEAVRQSGVPRKEIFVTTKIPCPPPDNTTTGYPVTPEMAVKAVEVDLLQLQMDYVDLVLLHWPCKTNMEDTLAAWRGLQEAHKRGLTRAIGVSNFLGEHLDAVMGLGGTPPAVNQCQMSVGAHDDRTIAHTKSLGVKYEAYSPLRRIALSDPVLEGIAAAHSKSTAQVALRWISQQGVLIATSPGQNEKYMLADMELSSFTLTGEEMRALSDLKSKTVLSTSDSKGEPAIE